MSRGNDLEIVQRGDSVVPSSDGELSEDLPEIKSYTSRKLRKHTRAKINAPQNPLLTDASNLFDRLNYNSDNIPVIDLSTEELDARNKVDIPLKVKLPPKGNVTSPGFVNKLLRHGSYPAYKLPSKSLSDTEIEGMNVHMKEIQAKIKEAHIVQERTKQRVEAAHNRGVHVEGAMKAMQEGIPITEPMKSKEEWTIKGDQDTVQCFASICNHVYRSIGTIQISGEVLNFFVDRRDRSKYAKDYHIPLGSIEACAVFTTPVSSCVADYFLLGSGDQRMSSDDTLCLIQLLVKEDHAIAMQNKSRVSSPDRKKHVLGLGDPIHRSILIQLNIDIIDACKEQTTRRSQAVDFCTFLNRKIEACKPLTPENAAKITQLDHFSGKLIERILDDLAPTSTPKSKSTPVSLGSPIGLLQNLNHFIFGSQQDSESEKDIEHKPEKRRHSLSVFSKKQSKKIVSETTSKNVDAPPRGADALLVQSSMEFDILSDDKATLDEDAKEYQCLLGFRFDESQSLGPTARFLSSFHKAQLSAILPPTLMHWDLVYCLRRDGISFQTLYKRLERHDRILMVLQDEHHCVFGAFIPTQIQYHSGYYGSRETFLFTFKKNAKEHGFSRSATQSLQLDQVELTERADKIKVYPWAARDNHVMYSDDTAIAFGGASGRGDFSITLDKDLNRGSSFTSETFNNDVLSTNRDFLVHNLQFWACD